MGRAAFLSAFVIVGLAGFLLPLPDAASLDRTWMAVRTADSIVVTGNSVVGHVSRCDADPRTLTGMIADYAERPVLDLSFNGQTVRQSVAYLGAALRNPRVHELVAAVSVFALADEGHFNLQKYLFFRLVDPGLSAEPVLARILSGDGFSGTSGDDTNGRAFTYRGTAYPDYRGIVARYFLSELRSMSCPEDDGRDARFVEAYYFHIYAEHRAKPENIELLASLSRAAAVRGKHLQVVILPIDYELMAHFRPDLPSLVSENAARVADALKRRGVEVTDLSATVPNGGFADRYCACGHLLGMGRRAVAAAIAEGMRQPVASLAVRAHRR